VTHWVWAPDPIDMWFGPYPEAEVGGNRDRLQEFFPTIGLKVIEDSRLVRRRIEEASKRLEEE